MDEVARITATIVPQYKLPCKHLLHRINPEQTIENHIIVSNLLLLQLHIALIPQLQCLQCLQRIFSRSAGQRAVQRLYGESIPKTVSLTPSQWGKRWDNGSAREGQEEAYWWGRKKEERKPCQSESASLAPAGTSSLFQWGIWPVAHICGAFISARVQLVSPKIPIWKGNFWHHILILNAPAAGTVSPMTWWPMCWGTVTRPASSSAHCALSTALPKPHGPAKQQIFRGL